MAGTEEATQVSRGGFRGGRRGGRGGGGMGGHHGPKREYTTNWPMTAVGKDVVGGGRQKYGDNLVQGDVSPEELRLEAYNLAPGGVSPEAIAQENAILQRHRELRESVGSMNGANGT